MTSKSNPSNSWRCNSLGNKVLLIGLDGATFELIKPWVETGELPVFRKLLTGGVHAELISTIPFTSLPAWTSVVTGKNPGKHGVFDFIAYEKQGIRVADSRHRKSETLWNILNRHGRKTIIINVPGTYPPEEIDGIMISGFPAPEKAKEFVYPKELIEYLFSEGYQIECPNFYANVTNKEQLLTQVLEVTEKRAKVALNLMIKAEWDFFAVVFTELDRLQHFFWNDHNVLLWYHRELDRIMGQFLEAVDAIRTNIIIVSDHGFGPLYKDFNVNNFLSALGLLKAKYENKRYFEMVVESIARKILPILSKYNLLPMVRLGKLLVKPDFSTSTIDFLNTNIYCASLSGQALRINRKQCNAEGGAGPKECQEIENRLIRALKMLKDPESNCRVIDRVYKREEIYWGPYIDFAPEILVTTEKGYAMQPMLSKKGFFTEAKQTLGINRSGDHRPKGVFIAYGPDIRRKEELGDISLYNIVPTILHIFDIPIPSDVDGRVLKELFIDKSELASRPVSFRNLASEKERIRKTVRLLVSENRAFRNQKGSN